MIIDHLFTRTLFESQTDHITQFASNAHEEWRRNFDPTGTKPRIKKNSDGTEGDINVPFADLHPDWQKENLAAAHAAHRAVKHFGRDMEKAAEYVHNEWMKRNPKADYNAAQHVPYDDLPEDEKEKDRVHVRTMMQLMGHHPEQGVAEGSVTHNITVNKVHDDGHEKEWHIYRGKEMIGYVIKNQPDTAEGLYIAYGHGPGRAFVKEFTGLKSAVNYIASLKQGVAEGSVTKKPQPYNDPNWVKKLPKEKLDAIAGPRHNKDKKDKDVKESNTLMKKLHQALLQEGRVKELADDLKTLNDAEFMKKYGKAKAAIRRDMKKVDENEIGKAVGTIAGQLLAPELAPASGMIGGAIGDKIGDKISGSDDEEMNEGNANSGRRGPNSPPDNTPVKLGRVQKLKTGIKHQADSSRYGGTAPDTDDDHLLSPAARHRLHKAVTPDQQDLDEGNMPQSVIKSKQKYADMSDQEFHVAHKNKSEDDLKNMAWRHGYGKGSNHYVNRHKKGGGQLNELSTNRLAQYKTAAAADAKQADRSGDVKRGDRRFSGIVKATKKQFDNDAKKIDESRQARQALMAQIVNSR